MRDLTTITPTLEINKGIYIKLSSEFSIDSSSKTGNVAIDKNGNPKIESIFNIKIINIIQIISEIKI